MRRKLSHSKKSLIHKLRNEAIALEVRWLSLTKNKKLSNRAGKCIHKEFPENTLNKLKKIEMAME